MSVQQEENQSIYDIEHVKALAEQKQSGLTNFALLIITHHEAINSVFSTVYLSVSTTCHITEHNTKSKSQISSGRVLFIYPRSGQNRSVFLLLR